MTAHIIWFKRDLRVEDHAPLAAAAAAGPVLPLFIVEPEWAAQPTSAPRQWRFIAESLAGLRDDLGRLGAPLVVRTGDPVSILEEIRQLYGEAALWSHEETGEGWSYARDRRVAAWARSRGVVWREFQNAGVVRRLRTRDGWAERWERVMAAPCVTPPTLSPIDPYPEVGQIPATVDPMRSGEPTKGAQRGGRREALSLLESFLAERGRDYRSAMATPLLAYDACSRISPHLAWGTLSVREAAQAARGRLRALDPDTADTRDWRRSIDSFVARLHWRCHFMQKLEDEPEIEHRCMHRAYEGLREGESDPQRLEAWAAGRTGWPFLDASMRALTATGWMNFRMRSMLTAVASYQLWLDWRLTGPVLARRFVDFEPGIHWSQMQMQSGVTGVNATRVYNPIKQGLDQDPEGRFIRAWVPELAAVPGAFVHTPWKMDAAQQRAAGCVIGRDYPAPLVDEAQAAREAKARVHAVRRGTGFDDQKAQVMKRHSSRKPGREGFPRRKRRAPPPAAQLTLDL